MQNIRKWESDGYYYVSYTPDTISGDDLGRASGEYAVRLLTDEGRTYYLQSVNWQEKLNRVINELESELRYLKTVKGANANLREVRKNRKSNGINKLELR